MEEKIREENIRANELAAYEHNPESFTRVSMLYIKAVVNKTPVKAFVDSGAAMTIMSERYAAKCKYVSPMITPVMSVK